MKKEILSWIGCFAIAILAALFIVTFVGQRVQVDGHSMEDTLQQLLEGADLPRGPEPAAAEKPDQPETARIYQFPTLDAVTQAAQVLDSSFDGHNSLYRDPAAKDYYLVISRQGYEENAFARVLNTIQEFGSRVKSSYATESYFEEHFELIIDGLAIQVLSAL